MNKSRPAAWLAVLLFLSGTAHAAYFAYAPAVKGNNDDSTASLFVADGEYASRVTEADIPGGVGTYTVSADGERVFLSHADGRLTVFDALNNRIRATLNRTSAWRMVAFRLTQDRERLYLSTNDGLVVLEGDPALADYPTTATLTLDYAGTGIALSPEGTRLLLSGGNGLSLVDPTPASGPVLLHSLDLGETTGQLQFSLDGAFAYLLLPTSHRLAKLDLTQDRIRLSATLDLGPGTDPRNLVVSPDGRIFVADHGVEDFSGTPSSGAVLVLKDGLDGLALESVIDTTGTLDEIGYNGTAPNRFPIDLGLSPDGSRLFLVQNVWPSQDAGVYLSIFQNSGNSWDELGRVEIGSAAIAVGDLVGPECTACPRGYRPMEPTPAYTRPAATGPLALALLLPLAWSRRRR